MGGLGATYYVSKARATFDIRAGLVIEPTKAAPTDLDRALGRRAGVRFQMTTRLVWGVGGPRHPLTY